MKSVMHRGQLGQLEAHLIKVFLIIKFSKTPLSIKVLATLYRPIGILTTKDRFLSDNSVSG
jgi:hypothetical protein